MGEIPIMSFEEDKGEVCPECGVNHEEMAKELAEKISQMDPADLIKKAGMGLLATIGISVMMGGIAGLAWNHIAQGFGLRTVSWIDAMCVVFCVRTLGAAFFVNIPNKHE